MTWRAEVGRAEHLQHGGREAEKRNSRMDMTSAAYFLQLDLTSSLSALSTGYHRATGLGATGNFLETAGKVGTAVILLLYHLPCLILNFIILKGCK